MKCSYCKKENSSDANFCTSCGKPLIVTCINCGHIFNESDMFCMKCGTPRFDQKQHETKISSTFHYDLSKPSFPSEEDVSGERKYVTVMFSDLSGYTAMSEKLDPEVVKEIMNKIFTEIAKVITDYDGSIDKFMGDAVLALFGIPYAHEDDAVRAVKAAIEIHSRVKKLGEEYREKIGKQLSMHTGIHTGLVVTGTFDADGAHSSIVGDTVNLASRIETLSESSDILISQNTHKQTIGFFDVESREPVKVKGKTNPIPIYKVIGLKSHPNKTIRLTGVRANLIGRSWELQQLMEGVNHLKQRQGIIVSISGEAGSGKSRLVEELKEKLTSSDILFLEGFAYPYTQDAPYSILTNLLDGFLEKQESDTREDIHRKIIKMVEGLTTESSKIIPYIAKLYSIEYEEVKQITSEDWKARLKQAVKDLLEILTTQKQIILCLDDLQWIDSSSLELFRELLLSWEQPVLFICIHRSLFQLFEGDDKPVIPWSRIALEELSPSEEIDMLQSLLKSPNVPQELALYIKDKAQGNPFYLEEVVNSLVESGVLKQEEDQWRLTRGITPTDLPPTIIGLLSTRIDRLERKAKRILQEASVIGRAFYYNVLNRISRMSDHLDNYLGGLESLDLIKAKNLEPELEYIFKHALTQEVAYNGMLISDREVIHGQIAEVIEDIFKSRLSEFYETLAFHFMKSSNPHRAVPYLIKSGIKSLNLYSITEAHSFFTTAYKIIDPIEDKSPEEVEHLMDIFQDWGYVFYFLGDFTSFDATYGKYEELASQMEDNSYKGMYYAWRGCCHMMMNRLYSSEKFLLIAKNIGEKIGNRKIIGYANMWLSFTNQMLLKTDISIENAKKARDIAKDFPEDQYLYFKSTYALVNAEYHIGHLDKGIQGGEQLLKYGKSHNHNRSLIIGYYIMAAIEVERGNYEAALEQSRQSIGIARDPLYSQFARGFMNFALLNLGLFDEARKSIEIFNDFAKKNSFDCYPFFIKPCEALILMAEGKFRKGVEIIKKELDLYKKENIPSVIMIDLYVYSIILLQLAVPPEPLKFKVRLRNCGFLLKHMPRAFKLAEEILLETIEIVIKGKITPMEARVHFFLAILYSSNKKSEEKSREEFQKAITMFEEMGMDGYLKLANTIIGGDTAN